MHRTARDGGYESDIDIATDDVIRANGGKAEYLETNAANYAAMEHLVRSAVDSFGSLDVMVNNAGIFTGLHTVVDETEDEYDRTMAVNAKSVWLGCKFAIKQMLGQEPVDASRGRIVNIASIGGLVGLAAEPAYCAAKGAVVNLTRQLAVDFAPDGSTSTRSAQGSLPPPWCVPSSTTPNSTRSCMTGRRGRNSELPQRGWF